MTQRVFSYGGGVQSTAALVLAAQGKIDFRTFIFANTGDDSEHAATLDYVATVARPYAERHGIAFIEVQKRRRDGTTETLLQHLHRLNSSIGIPVRMNTTGAPGNRNCTMDFKIRPIAKWLKAHGATADAPAVVGLGISIDEFQRMRSDSGFPFYTLAYPLIDRHLRRDQCQTLIAEAGLPVPEKSSCWFCPYHRRSFWMRMRADDPARFDQAADLEAMLNARRVTLGKNPVWFTDQLRPLRDAISDQMAMNFDDDASPGSCMSGFCESGDA